MKSMNKKDSKGYDKEVNTNEPTSNVDAKSKGRNKGRNKRDSRNGSNNSRTSATTPAAIDRLQFETITTTLGRAINLSRSHAISSHLYTIPGLVRYTFTPNIGSSYGSTSPFNINNQSVQNVMRALGKYNRSYDPSDIGMYALAMTSYSMFDTWVRNIFRACHLITTENIYYPRGYLRALRADVSVRNADEVLKLQSLINNVMTYELNAMYLPKDFAPIAYYKDIQDGLMLEKPELGARSQAFMFMPSGFYRYTPRDGNTPGSATYYSLDDLKEIFDTDEYFKVDDLIKINDFLHGALFNDGDINAISQDIRESISNAEPLLFDYVEEHEMPVIKEITDSFKISIRNMDIVGSVESKSMKVVQVIKLTEGKDENFVKFSPKISKGGTGGTSHTDANIAKSDMIEMLYFNGGEGSNEDMFHATRFKCLVGYQKDTDDSMYDKLLHGSKGGVYILNSGPEIINRVDIFWSKYDPKTQKVTDWNEVVLGNSVVTYSDTFNNDSFAEVLAGIQSIYPFPVFYMPKNASDSLSQLSENVLQGVENGLIPVGTLDQFSPLPDEVLKNAHRVRTQHLWNFGLH